VNSLGVAHIIEELPQLPPGIREALVLGVPIATEKKTTIFIGTGVQIASRA
jgi:hypothetical protein